MCKMTYVHTRYATHMEVRQTLTGATLATAHQLNEDFHVPEQKYGPSNFFHVINIMRVTGNHIKITFMNREMTVI